jgi:hypothetical protein
MRTRTYDDWSKFLGSKAHKLGIVAKLYPQNTISALTDLLGNVWMGDQKRKLGGFQSIDSTYFEWEVGQFVWTSKNSLNCWNLY